MDLFSDSKVALIYVAVKARFELPAGYYFWVRFFNTRS